MKIKIRKKMKRLLMGITSWFRIRFNPYLFRSKKIKPLMKEKKLIT